MTWLDEWRKETLTDRLMGFINKALRSAVFAALLLFLLITSLAISPRLSAQMTDAHPLNEAARPITGPAEAQYDKAISLLKVIGPGAADAAQMYRYESAPLDLTIDNNDHLASGDAGGKWGNSTNDRNGWMSVKNNSAQSLDDIARDSAVTQIVTDMAQIRKTAARAGATEADREKMKRAETALKDFVRLGQETFEAAMKSNLDGQVKAGIGNNYDASATEQVLKGTNDLNVTQTAVKQSLTLILGAANVEHAVSMVQSAANTKPDIVHVTPPTGSAREQYESVVKILKDGFGQGTADGFEAIRYAREPIDKTLDAKGNDMFPEDTKAIAAKRKVLDAPSPDGTIPNGFLVGDFGVRAILNVVNVNDTAYGRAGFDRRHENVYAALNAFIVAGGGDPKAAEKNASQSGTYDDDRNPFYEGNRQALMAQLYAAAGNIINNLIHEEHPGTGQELQLRPKDVPAAPSSPDKSVQKPPR
jgi:hypothetical protein